MLSLEGRTKSFSGCWKEAETQVKCQSMSESGYGREKWRNLQKLPRRMERSGWAMKQEEAMFQKAKSRSCKYILCTYFMVPGAYNHQTLGAEENKCQEFSLSLFQLLTWQSFTACFSVDLSPTFFQQWCERKSTISLSHFFFTDLFSHFPLANQQ